MDHARLTRDTTVLRDSGVNPATGYELAYEAGII